jgi:hypothetical protein
MSDKPLFQNADEQEAAYAGTSGGGQGETDLTNSGVVIPGATMGNVLNGNIGTSAGMVGVPNPGPVIAGAGRSTREDADDDGVVEPSEEQR